MLNHMMPAQAKGSKTTPANERNNQINDLFKEMNLFKQHISEASHKQDEDSSS